MTYDELYQKYLFLVSECARLRAENAELKRQFGTRPEESASEQKTVLGSSNAEQAAKSFRVHKYSTPSEKIALFRSLFAGREDVYARRWYSKTTGKSGYQPACENEWVQGLCDKHVYKCAACPNRQLKPLDDSVIYDHLAGKDEYGRDVIGIYPMLKDETCLFLTADFDEQNYAEDVSVYREICDEWRISVSIERSRSGNGAHAWIFFEKPIQAALARRLGTTILTAAMERRGELSFKSYDRLFPNQDTMPTGGFGNLIALPLQGLARKNGNSLFVNEDYIPYADQWAYLSTIKRVAQEEVEAVLEQHGKKELGTLIENSDEKPWETIKQQKLTRLDFPQRLIITCANMLYLSRSGLSSAAVNALKRLAAFKNPEFYKAQAMRMPTYDKPRIICCAELDERYVALPRGCEEPLCRLFESIDVDYVLVDQRNAGHPIPVTFNGILREEQTLAADALLAYDTGVLSATTAFGKTVVASYLIGQRKTNTLILVHTQALLVQWKKALESFLDFDLQKPEKKKGRGRPVAWSPVGTLGANRNTLHGIVDVAIMQSMISDGEVKDTVKNYGMVIVDECHHVSAVSFEKVLQNVNAKYVYGLTATPIRQDGHHPIIYMQCGPIRYRVNAKKQAEQRPFDHILIPRFTTYRTTADKKITELYKDLSESNARNKQIVEDVVASVRQGRTPIILTERRDHVERLRELLSVQCDNIVTLVGTVSAKERRETLQRLEGVRKDESLVIIATGRYVGEGFDYPRLDTLFLALPIAWRGKVEQYTGRLHRLCEGKTEVHVYDYIDIHVPMLERMYQKRMKGYSSIGYKTRSDVEEPETPDIIYDGRSYDKVYQSDLANAKREVLIVSPSLSRNRITKLMQVLMSRIVDGISVTVVTRPSDDYRENQQMTVNQNVSMLENGGIRVRYKVGLHQKFTLIDGEIVWYGSVSTLAYNSQEDSIMRFASDKLAGALMDTVMNGVDLD